MSSWPIGWSKLLPCSLPLLAALAVVPRSALAAACGRTITADVVVFDQPLMFNRLGAQNVNGIMYALRRDVVSIPQVPGQPASPSDPLEKGKVMLRPDKRPRPLVLRVAAGDCLQVNFQNLLSDVANQVNNPPDFTLPKVDDQVADRMAGFHVQGLSVVRGPEDDASSVGNNASSLVGPGGNKTYLLRADHEGTYLVTSHGATFGGEGAAGNTGTGMFAVVNVEPAGASFYRSQVTEEELRLASRGTTPTGQPNIDYDAVYPATVDNGDGTTSPSVWAREGKAGLPILSMLDASNELVHSDLTAIIAGPENGAFPASTYPLESQGLRNPTVPNRLEPFREYTIGFHDEMAASQAFPRWYQDPVLGHTLHAVGDIFMINYGSGGVGSEVIASRLGVGPMHDCLDCVYEEFFLTSYAVGDPAMVVDRPANFGLEECAPPGAGPACAAKGPKATKAYYPDDPSNVYHSYINDFVKFRNVHTGSEHHVFHLHNHQWLFNPSDDNSNYLDAQGIGPGGGYTYEINFGGSGNRNKSAGDAIFHCHFYPHFAMGMWGHWRNHDVFEAGTPLKVSPGPDGFHVDPYALKDGEPAVIDETTGARARALPDGEIVAGTPIPAVVPLPGKPMAVMPGRVTVVKKESNGVIVGSVAQVDRSDTDASRVHEPLNPTGLKNPGYPFWLAGIEHAVGQRTTTPPLDMLASAGGWDGGLPRHALDGYAASGCATDRAACDHAEVSRFDLTKEIKKAKPIWFPEDGTDVEKAAMAFHAHVREHPTTAVGLNGEAVASSFITNGSGGPVPGAPYHDPCIDDTGHRLVANYVGKFFTATGLGELGSSPFNAENPRVYKGAAMQFDAVLNKLGYHYPQQRITALWDDVLPTINKQRPAEPFVIRLNTFDCAMYQHTNLVPAVFELDDYQIRTATDIIGQHIHLPKWDLTTTDGSANGWNYEDGTLPPDAVRERIHAINAFNPTGDGNPVDSKGRQEGTPLVEQAHPFFPPTGPGGVDWRGARTTLQRWFSDPVINVDNQHRGLGIIFTHDHYGPSTHQQVGLYASVLSEPPGSTWVHNETGQPFYTRHDGGPTSWQAAIIDNQNPQNSHREFFLMFADFQHAYKPGVYIGRNQDGSLGPGPTADSFRDAVNPSVKKQSTITDVIEFPAICPGGAPRPCPEGISAADPGFLVVNYRNEPVGFRVFDPAKPGPDQKPGAQADGLAGDLAFALQSRTDRKIPRLNSWPAAGTSIDGTIFPPPINAGGVGPGDPFTPLVRSYFGDPIRIKIQAGAHEESHNATVHGAKWLQSGSGYGFAPNSGWRNSQHSGISEQFTFSSPTMPMLNGGQKADALWSINASIDGFWNGVWGIHRSRGTEQKNLFKLPNNATFPITIANATSFDGVCPKTAASRLYDVTAVLANDVLDRPAGVSIVPTDASGTQHVGGALNPNGGTLVYNPRATQIAGTVPGPNGLETVDRQGPLHDPTAILYVMTADLVARNPSDPACLTRTRKVDPTLPGCPVQLRPATCTGGKCTPGAPVEPIVLRAAAGECMKVTLRNRLPAKVPDLAGWKHLPAIVQRDANDDLTGAVTTFNNNLVRPSSYVALHPTTVAYDVNKDDGHVVGENGLGNNGAGIVVPPGGKKTFQWYAGDLSLSNPGSTANLVATPVELGGTNLGPADIIKQGAKGLGGAIVIEPAGSTWAEGDLVTDHQKDFTSTSCATTPLACRATRQSATVNGTIRDLAAVVQKGMNHRYADGAPVEMIGGEGSIAEDAEDSGHMSLNYGSEPMWFRFGIPPHSPFTGGEPGVTSMADLGDAHRAFENALAGGDPATPVFTALAGAETRLHLLHPTGSNRASAFTLHGHAWQRAPYICPGSSKDGIPGKCLNTGFYPTTPGFEVASRAIGDNKTSIYMGAQDLVAPASHFDLHLPSAGGSSARPGDYLFMDRAAQGTISGLWSLLRVK